MKQTDKRKVIIEVQGYVQGKELVERFLQGCYDIKIETIAGRGENLVRYNLSLIITRDTIFNFYKKKLKKKVIGMWKYIKNGG